MGPKAAYGEKLLDPRWQKRRLEIFERDEWVCRGCRRASRTLHVHHLWYDGEPWEVPDNALLTLCAECHKTETTGRSDAEADFLAAIRQGGWLVKDLEAVTDTIGAGGEFGNTDGMGILVAMLFDEPAFRNEVWAMFRARVRAMYDT